jgi:hypothetical protein
MRRLLASLLLVVISLSLVSPVLASAAKSNLPACCLRHGKHHCAMAAEISTHGGPGLRDACPFRTYGSLLASNDHKFLAATRISSRSALLPAITLESRHELPPAQRQMVMHGKRGPPSRFA